MAFSLAIRLFKVGEVHLILRLRLLLTKKYSKTGLEIRQHIRPVTGERICARGEEGNLGSRRNTHGVGSGSESGFGTAAHHHL